MISPGVASRSLLMPNDSIGVRLMKAQHRLGMRNIAVAERAEVKPSNYSRFLYDRNVPSVPTLIKLAEALHTSTDYLCGLTSNPNPRKP